MANRFSAQESTVTKELVSIMRQMNASNLKVNKDLFNGLVEIIFDRKGKRYVFRCKSYDNALDNYRAAQLSITYLFRALESYGVSSEEKSIFDKVFDNFFLGFQATPNDDVLMLSDGNVWFEILGVKPDSTKEDIINAYRSLAKVHHPDTGGKQELFLKLRKAYEEGLSKARA
jgi:DnaJ-domain-containing protein 1